MQYSKRFAVKLLLLISLGFAGCATTSPPYTFSVFGDSRLPGNMKFTSDQQGEGGPIDRYIQANFIGKTINDVALRFDSAGRLTGLRVPATGSPYKDITLDEQGWPLTIVDTSQDPSLVLKEGGQDWVYREAAESVALAGTEGFVLHTGDIAYNGYYGVTPQTSVYWADFKTRLLDSLPPGAPQGLSGRFFPAVGNHETWLDPDMEGLRTTVPYLQPYGVGAERHIYAFDYNNSRFIFLDTGGYDPPAGWGNDSKPSYYQQMQELQNWLNDAQQKGIGHVFVSLHKPPFCSAGHGHLDVSKNPHPILAHYANDPRHPLDVTVFSGHVHSSELYYQDKVRYLVLGGGGADQVYSTIDCAASDPYCQGELYWHGEKRSMEYNHLIVTVDGKNIAFALERWRPEAAHPFQRCLIDASMQVSACD